MRVWAGRIELFYTPGKLSLKIDIGRSGGRKFEKRIYRFKRYVTIWHQSGFDEPFPLSFSGSFRPLTKSIRPELAASRVDTIAWTIADQLGRSADTIQAMETNGLKRRGGRRHNMASKVEKRELGRTFLAPDGKKVPEVVEAGSEKKSALALRLKKVTLAGNFVYIGDSFPCHN